MVVEFDVELHSLDGSVLQDSATQKITLKNISVNALLTPADEKLAGEEKLKRYNLAQKIYASTAGIDMTTEEIALVKKLIGEIYPPLIVGQTWAMLEGK